MGSIMAGVGVESSGFPSFYSPPGGVPSSIMQRAGMGGAGGTFYAGLDAGAGSCGGKAGGCYSIPTGSANSWAYPFVDAGLPNQMPMGNCGGGGSSSVSYSGPSGYNAGDLAGFY